MHDLHAQAEHFFCPLLASALVTRIHPQVREVLKVISYTLQQQLDPILIGNLGAVDLGFKHQAFCVYQQVTLPAANLLPTIVSPRFSTHPSSLCRLGIHYSSTGLRVSPQPYSQAFTQSCVESLPRAIDAPDSEVVMYGLPGRKVVGK